MTIITQLANGNIEIFESNNYVICKSKDFHPMICKVDVYSNGIKIKSVSRHFKFFYKHFIFKTKKVQDKLNQILESENKLNQVKENKN